jgi:DNA invertase Pin-like site-specific DNA recombinase
MGGPGRQHSISLKDGLDLVTPAGRLMANILAGVAAYETEVRAERIPAGQSAARDRGVHWGGSARGRRIKVTGEQVAAIRRLRSEGEEIAAIARTTGLSRPTIYRILGETCQGSILPGDGGPAKGIACATRPM